MATNGKRQPQEAGDTTWHGKRLAYSKHFFALLREEQIDDGPKRFAMCLEPTLDELEQSSLPSVYDKNVAVYQLKEIDKYEKLCDRYNQQTGEPLVSKAVEIEEAMERLHAAVELVKGHGGAGEIEAALDNLEDLLPTTFSEAAARVKG
jgi:hypothetical protein